VALGTLNDNARAENTHTPTTPRTRLSGTGGRHSWTVASFRAWLRAWSACYDGIRTIEVKQAIALNGDEEYW